MQFFNNSKVGVIVGALFVSTHFESAEGIQVQDGGLTAACVAGGVYAAAKTGVEVHKYYKMLKDGRKEAKGIGAWWAKRKLKQQVAKSVSQHEIEDAKFELGDIVQIKEDKFFIVVGFKIVNEKGQDFTSPDESVLDKYALQKVEREITFDVNGNFKTTFTVKPQIVFYKADDDKLKKMHFTNFNPVEVLNKKKQFSKSSSDANSIIKIPVGAVFTAPENESGEENVDL